MIVTVYNEAECVVAAVNSILSQSMSDHEVVVVDDGSVDDTVAILHGIEDERLRVIKAGRLGRAGALKRAVQEARGQYIANLDADDEALPGRLAAQASFLDAHPAVAWIGGAEEMVDERRGERYIRRYPQEDGAIRRQCTKSIPYSHSAVMFRRSLIDEDLNYDPDQLYLIDFEFFLRVARRHEVANLAEIVVRRHVRSESYFQSRFSTTRQNRRLARMCAKAVGEFGLPPTYYAFSLARLGYPLLPDRLKRAVRRRQGLSEREVPHIE